MEISGSNDKKKQLRKRHEETQGQAEEMDRNNTDF